MPILIVIATGRSKSRKRGAWPALTACWPLCKSEVVYAYSALDYATALLTDSLFRFDLCALLESLDTGGIGVTRDHDLLRVATGHWDLGALGPTLAGLIMTALEAGWPGLRSLGRRLWLWRVGLQQNSDVP